MLKQLKPDQLYFIIKINEPYAEQIFELLKKGQIEKGDWEEGTDITFTEWVKQTFGQRGLDYIEKI